MLHVKQFGTIWGQKPYKASDSGALFNLVRSIDFLVQFAAARRRCLDGLAGLRAGTPDVRFADQNRGCHRGCPSRRRLIASVTSNTPAANDGPFLTGLMHKENHVISMAIFSCRITDLYFYILIKASKQINLLS